VAGHLRRLIDRRLVLPGQALPSAQELSRQLRVNRLAVLAAFQDLQAEERLVVRRGRFGARVVPVEERSLESRRRLAAAVQLHHVVPFREIMDAGIARLAAERGLPDRTLAELGDLAALMRQTRQRDHYLAHDSEFHAVLARGCGNPTLAELGLTLRQSLLVVLDAEELTEDAYDTSDHEHARLLAAVRRRSPGAASDWAVRHARSTATLAGWPSGRPNPVGGGFPPGRPRRPPDQRIS
jgi:DNA-binding FadR family transcriptional regulator